VVDDGVGFGNAGDVGTGDEDDGTGDENDGNGDNIIGDKCGSSDNTGDEGDGDDDEGSSLKKTICL
jgi:hypothetical protein